MCLLHARFEHTYLANPRLFAKLGCRMEDFEKEVALLLHRRQLASKGLKAPHRPATGPGYNHRGFRQPSRL